MARSIINDYTLELGWSGSKVTKGIDALERRINKLAATSAKLHKSTTLKSTELNKVKAASDAKIKNEKAVTAELVKQKKLQQDTLKQRQKYIQSSIASAKKKQGTASNKVNQASKDEVWNQIITERKLTMLKQADDKVRSLKKNLLNLDMKVKGSAKAEEAIHRDIAAVKAYRKQLETAKITSRKSLHSQREDWVALSGQIENTRMKVLHANKQVGFTGSVLKRAAGSFVGATAAIIAAQAVFGAAGALFQNQKEWESLTVQMQASFGSAEEGAKQLKFLRATADELGLGLAPLADGYAKIGATGRMVGLSTEQVREVFLGASEASRAFGLSVDDTQGVMRAFSQMLGKNQVMAEELKLQMGDRFPIAMGIMAKAIGKTIPEMTAMMEAGELGQEEILKFSSALRQTVRDSGALAASMNTLESEQQRFVTALSFAGTAFMGGEMQGAFKDMFKMLADFFKETEEFWALLGDIFGIVLKFGFKLIGKVLKPIQNILGHIGKAWTSIGETSLIDKSDLDTLTGFQKILRFITGLWFDITSLLKVAGSWIDYFIDKLTGGGFIEAVKSLFEEVKAGFEGEGTPAGNRGKRGKINKNKVNVDESIAAGVSSAASFWLEGASRTFGGDGIVAQAFKTDAKANSGRRTSSFQPVAQQTVTNNITVKTDPKDSPEKQAAMVRQIVAQENEATLAKSQPNRRGK